MKHQSVILNDAGKQELLHRCSNERRLINAVSKRARVIAFRISDNSYLIKFPGINKYFSVHGSGIEKYDTQLN